MNIDNYGLILSGDPVDGGDSAHTTYSSLLWIYVLLKEHGLASKLKLSIAGPMLCEQRLEVKPGIYVRHPDPAQWYSDPRNFSRDQTTPIICLHAYMASIPQYSDVAKQRQSRLLKSCLKRGMFAQNIYPNWIDPRIESVKAKIPDFLDPSLWGIFARTWIGTPWVLLAFPFVILGDLSLILAVICKILFDRAPDEVDDDNINNCLIVSQYIYETPFSWIARKLFKAFRAKNYGNTKLSETTSIQGAASFYHRDNPELAELIRPILDRY